MANKAVDITVKVLKCVGAGIVTGAIIEGGYLGARMLQNDIEYVADTVDSKINPTIMKRRNIFSKPEKFNTRTKKWVEDKKSKKCEKKSK
jgi:hypothetical protein